MSPGAYSAWDCESQQSVTQRFGPGIRPGEPDEALQPTRELDARDRWLGLRGHAGSQSAFRFVANPPASPRKNALGCTQMGV
jgi:hypothetical protein